MSLPFARTVGGLEELVDAITNEGGTATLVPMDITDFDAIDRLGGEISKRWGKLDGLFANAAILGDITPLGHVDTKQFEKFVCHKCHRQLALHFVRSTHYLKLPTKPACC